MKSNITKTHGQQHIKKWVSLVSVSLNSVVIPDWCSDIPSTHFFLYPSHIIYWCFVQTKSYSNVLCPNEIFVFQSNIIRWCTFFALRLFTVKYCKLLVTAEAVWLWVAARIGIVVAGNFGRNVNRLFDSCFEVREERRALRRDAVVVWGDCSEVPAGVANWGTEDVLEEGQWFRGVEFGVYILIIILHTSKPSVYIFFGGNVWP